MRNLILIIAALAGFWIALENTAPLAGALENPHFEMAEAVSE
jgi:hypothetical protein